MPFCSFRCCIILYKLVFFTFGADFGMPNKKHHKQHNRQAIEVRNPFYQMSPHLENAAAVSSLGDVYENTAIRGLNENFGFSSNQEVVVELEDPNEDSEETSVTFIPDTGSNTETAENTYYNTAEAVRRRIPLNQLAEFVANKTKETYEAEFKSLPEGLIKPYTESQRPHNITKNRYKGVYPYCDYRVVIKGGDSDYINASYIDGHKHLKAYIASLGPTKKFMGDLSDFWRMVWQERCGEIIMLTNITEGGVLKCDQYWPNKKFSKVYADITLTCHKEERNAYYTVRSFHVQKQSERRNVTQFHFTAWPDKGVPNDVKSLLEFRQTVTRFKSDLSGPVIVHCSAGIGRTGTYIALDILTKEGQSEGTVDIYACVRNMREQRVNMVQTAEQYKFLHNALVQSLTLDSY